MRQIICKWGKKMKNKKETIQEDIRFKEGQDIGMQVAIDILKHKFDEAVKEIKENFKIKD